MSSYLITKTSPTSKSEDHLSELKSSFSEITSFLIFEGSCGFALYKIVYACEVSNKTMSREISMHNQLLSSTTSTCS